MLRATMVGIFVGSVLLLAACSTEISREAPAGVEANEEMALSVAQALVDGDFDAARADFSTTMQAALSKEKLEKVWVQEAEPKGEFKSLGEIYIEYANDSPCVFVPCVFEEGEVVVQVTQDAKGSKVTGLYLRPEGYSFLP